MAAAQYFEQVQKIFIAFYQRPADPAGLKYWAERVDAAGGNINEVINAFASSAEATTLYGAIDATTIGTVVDSLYMALFNVAPDAAGKAFYVDGFAAGTFTAGTIALAVLNGAQNDDLIAVNNKVQVANEFTKQVDGRALTDAYFGTGSSFNVTYSGDADTLAARGILKAVTFLPSTVINPSQVTDALKAQIANPGDVIIGQTGGQTYTLTTGQDNIAGTNGNDTISGDHTTLQATDSINGGTGTDTFNYTDARTTAVAGDKMPAALVSNVEIINVRNVNGTAAIPGTKEVATFSFADVVVPKGATIAETVIFTIAGRTVTLTGADSTGADTTFTAANIASAFAGSASAGITVGGTLDPAYTVALGSGNSTVFTGAAVGNQIVNLAAAKTGTAVTIAAIAVPGVAVVDGTAGSGSTGANLDVVASNFAGATDFNSNLSTNAVDFTKLANGQKVGLIGNGATELGAVSAGYNASATDAVINVTGGVGPTGTVAPAVTVTGTILANATINSTGAANKVGAVTLSGTETAVTINAATNLTAASLVDAGLKTLTISGAATSVAITAALASTVLTSVDASGLTAGGAKVGIGANLATTFKGGAGNDTVTILQNAAMTGTVDGGAGVNTLAISSNVNGADTSLVAATASKFTNFQTLQVAATGAAGDKSVFDGSLLAVTNFNVGASTGGVSIINLAAAPTINVVGAVAGTAGLELGFKTPSATNADVANLVFNNANVLTTGNVAGTSLSVLKLGTSDATLNITSSGSIIGTGAANTITTLTAADTGLKQINITGNQAFSLTTGALTKSFNIDGSTATGQLTIDASLATAGTTAVNINGGSNNDTIKASTLTTTATADLIYGGGGGDAITLGLAHTAKNTLVYKAASDSLLDVVGVSGAGTTLQKNVGKMDVITNFISGTDKIDVSAFAFAGAQKGAVINDAYASNALMVAGVNGAAGTNFFNDASATARAVKVVTDGTDTFVFVDANKDGSFNAATDMVIKLIGAAVPVIADISF